jgi:hypothetical protein
LKSSTERYKASISGRPRVKSKSDWPVCSNGNDTAHYN